MEEIKLTWEEYQKRIQQVREAVIEDLNAVDPENTILKVRLWCRDEEDRFDLVCFEDFSPYMDGLYKRFNPDVVNLIRHDYEGLKRWYNPQNYREERQKRYRSEVYSDEQLCKKYYVTVTKYVEIKGEMTILYSADLSLKGEVITVDDPTGYYSGFDYKSQGYYLSSAEKIISDNIDLFWMRMTNLSVELPYQHGDIVYVDGSPYEEPFYGVVFWGRFLYVENAERMNILKKNGLPKAEYAYPYISLSYHKSVPAFYQVSVLDTCKYKCLVEASKVLKSFENHPLYESPVDIRPDVQDIFEEEFKDSLLLSKSNGKMKDIVHLLSSVTEKYQDFSFTQLLHNFTEWLHDTKRISLRDLDDEAFLNLITEYCQEDLYAREEQRKKFERLCEDRDLDWNKKVIFSEHIFK